MEIKEWCVNSTLEIKNILSELISKNDFEKDTAIELKKLTEACNVYLNFLDEFKTDGIIYKNGKGDWVNYAFSKNMKSFRNSFKSSIIYLSNKYQITFDKIIPDQY